MVVPRIQRQKVCPANGSATPSAQWQTSRYEYSRDQCIRAARNCLKLMTDDHGTAVFLERWWILLFYGTSWIDHRWIQCTNCILPVVTVAAVVVLIDLLVCQASSFPEIWLLSLSITASVSGRSGISRRNSKALRGGCCVGPHRTDHHNVSSCKRIGQGDQAVTP